MSFEHVEIYCDGAAMAYRDCAAQIRTMIKNAPKEIRGYLQEMEPIAAACESKAVEIYNEAKRYGGARQ